jgi:diadenylate cyclase
LNLLYKIANYDITLINSLDILLVGLLLYYVYKIIKGTLAFRIILGGFFIFGIWWLARFVELKILSEILGQFLGVGVLGALILYQQEIRRFLGFIGKGSFLKNSILTEWFYGNFEEKVKIDVQEFVEASEEMASTLTGALIVFTKEQDLSSYYNTAGVFIDAIPHKRLIQTIFAKNTPTHDGAMIVGKDGRIKAVQCILPVTDNPNIPQSFGLRHRSALGISEQTDAVVLLVSEQTGKISVAKQGDIKFGITPREARKVILQYLNQENSNEE